MYEELTIEAINLMPGDLIESEGGERFDVVRDTELEHDIEEGGWVMKYLLIDGTADWFGSIEEIKILRKIV